MSFSLDSAVARIRRDNRRYEEACRQRLVAVLVEGSEFAVELVDITGANDFFAQQIRRQGQLLWGVR